MLNRKLLLDVKRHILAKPKRFVMGAFVQIKGLNGNDDKAVETCSVAGPDKWKFPECGTAACIAGWGLILSNYEPTQVMHLQQNGTVAETAAKVFGISSGEAGVLFHVGGWPKKFRRSFAEAKSIEARAEIAAKRIDFFIRNRY